MAVVGDQQAIRGIGPALIARLPELDDRWQNITRGWHRAPPPDLPGITRAAIERGEEAARMLLRAEGMRLGAQGVPLERVVSAVLDWEQLVASTLGMEPGPGIVIGTTALGRLTHQLVVAVAAEQEDAVRRGLEETDRLKSELVAMISHDLKTPLTTIQACALSLRDMPDLAPDDHRRFAEMIFANADRLSRLITQIVDVSRISARAVELDVRPVDVVEVVSHARALLPGNDRVVISDDGVPAVMADRDALERIVANLLDNALRATGETVNVGLRVRGTMVEITVADQGPGIPQHRREGLFERFYQVEPSASGRRTGSGLGLAIVRGLAEAMAGEAGYRPNEPKGSVFWVRLPRAS